jgi:hypothetical protein
MYVRLVEPSALVLSASVPSLQEGTAPPGGRRRESVADSSFSLNVELAEPTLLGTPTRRWLPQVNAVAPVAPAPRDGSVWTLAAWLQQCSAQ